ncbi:ARM repeat-containing protein, partial [Rozella allomycis CSF55]
MTRNIQDLISFFTRNKDFIPPNYEATLDGWKTLTNEEVLRIHNFVPFWAEEYFINIVIQNYLYDHSNEEVLQRLATTKPKVFAGFISREWLNESNIKCLLNILSLISDHLKPEFVLEILENAIERIDDETVLKSITGYLMRNSNFLLPNLSFDIDIEKRKKSWMILSILCDSNDFTEKALNMDQMESILEDIEFESDDCVSDILKCLNCWQRRKEVRKLLSLKCKGFLKQKVHIEKYKTLSLVCLSKIELKIEYFKQLVRQFPLDSSKEEILEALVAGSSIGEIKEYLCKEIEIFYRFIENDCNESLHLKHEEMKKLAKIAKQFVPDDDALNEDEFVSKRCKIILKSKILSLLIKKSKSEENLKLFVKLSNSIVRDQENRNEYVKQCGIKHLLKSISFNKDDNEIVNLASVALSRICISVNPNLGFSTSQQQELCVIFNNMLKTEDSLTLFETLLALTNMVSIGKEIQSFVFERKMHKNVEVHLLHSNERIQCAAAEFFCNLSMFTPFVESCASSSKLQLFVYLMDAHMTETRSAASGCLAIMCEQSDQVCQALVKCDRFINILSLLIKEENHSLVERGLVILASCVHYLQRKERLEFIPMISKKT